MMETQPASEAPPPPPPPPPTSSVVSVQQQQQQRKQAIAKGPTAPQVKKKANATSSAVAAVSSADLLTVLSGQDDEASLMPAPEETSPYFPERWPGKLCILCNLGERSQLGQGEMLRFEAPAEIPVALTEEKVEETVEEKNQSTAAAASILASNKRQKGLNKCKVPAANAEYVDELEKCIGHTEICEFSSLVDAGFYYVHRSCAIWSFGVQRETNGTFSNLTPVVIQAMKAKCSFCARYGASLFCKMSCPKVFHFPCVAAAGGFQVS